MHTWFFNVLHLSLKELRCVLRDRTMMGAIVISFTVAVYVVALGAKADVTHVAVGILDSDHSTLSQRIRAAIRPPLFQEPVDLTRDTAQAEMDEGRYLFVLDIPEHFEADVQAQRPTEVQLWVDATAMAQGQLGVAYLTEIVLRETLDEFKAKGIDARLPTRPVVHVLFNPNTTTSWFTSVMQLINNVTVLSVVLVGAAVIREREKGTIEHLLVILVAVAVSVLAIAKGLLLVPVEGSVVLFLMGTGLYLFSLTALGILLATVASSMPQFGLLAVPVFVVMYLLSGSATPVENMPLWLQLLMQLSPSTHYVKLAQGILYRAAGVDIVWPQMVAVGGIGAAFLALALLRFRSMLARQG